MDLHRATLPFSLGPLRTHLPRRNRDHHSGHMHRPHLQAPKAQSQSPSRHTSFAHSLPLACLRAQATRPPPSTVVIENTNADYKPSQETTPQANPPAPPSPIQPTSSPPPTFNSSKALTAPTSPPPEPPGRPRSPSSPRSPSTPSSSSSSAQNHTPKARSLSPRLAPRTPTIPTISSSVPRLSSSKPPASSPPSPLAIFTPCAAAPHPTSTSAATPSLSSFS